MVMAVAVMSHHAKLAGGDLRRVQLPHGRGNLVYDSATSLLWARSRSGAATGSPRAPR